MLGFLTAEGSPFHKVPHSIATFVFVLILLHVAAFCAWLVVFLRKTLSSEDERMKQFLQNREVRPFTHLIVIRYRPFLTLWLSLSCLCLLSIRNSDRTTRPEPNFQIRPASRALFYLVWL